jgi:hypothetical protein
VTEPCQRFDEEALERIEAGLPLDEHFSSCPDCLKRQEGYRQIAEGLRTLHREEPRVGWEDRVLSRISEKTRGRAARRRSTLATGSAILVAAAAGWIFFLRGERPPSHPTFAAVVRPSQIRQLRGGGVRPGDILELTANRAGVEFAEIRLYRNDSELVFRCPDPGRPPERGQTCFVRSQLLVSTLPLPSVGVFQPMLVTSKRPLPESSGNFQTDSARLVESGAAVLLGPSVRAY